MVQGIPQNWELSWILRRVDQLKICQIRPIFTLNRLTIDKLLTSWEQYARDLQSDVRRVGQRVC